MCGYAGPEASAVFGLNGDLGLACRQTLEAIGLIEDSVQRLNARLASDIGALGKLVLAAHCGSVVSGMMGHPDAKMSMAVGLAVDVTKRLRDHAQSTGSGCVLSKNVLEGAGRTGATTARHDADRNQDDLRLQVRAGASLSECLAEGAKYTGFPARP